MPIEPEAAERYRERIAAHAADRAALVAQLEGEQAESASLTLALAEVRAKVTELTRERDEAREGDGYWHASAVAEGKAKLRAEGELRMQERATQQLSAEVTRLTETLHEVQQAHTNANSNLQLAEARCTRLNEALAAAELRAGTAEAHAKAHDCRAHAAEARVRELEAADREAAKCIRELSDLRDAAESECAALRAEVERFRRDALNEAGHAIASEDRLAAANALLMRIPECLLTDCPVYAELVEYKRAHLAAQPSTAPDVRTVRVSPEGMNTVQRFTMQVTAQPAPAPDRDEAEAHRRHVTVLHDENAALRAEVERFRRDALNEAGHAIASEDRLAAANALPARIWEALGELTSYLVDGDHMVKVDDVRHTFECHLAAQPATAPARTEAESGDDLTGALACCRAWEPEARLIGNVRASTLLRLLERTEAEQAALDILDQRVEYAIECGYVQHAAVDWLRDSVRTLLRGLK